MYGDDTVKNISSQFFHDSKDFCTDFLNRFLPFIFRIGLLLAKAFDLFGLPKIMDLLWRFIKFNTRSLTPIERKEALSVFEDSINYSKVLIDECSLIAWLGAKINGCLGMGITIFNTINFSKKIRTTSKSSDMKWLMHELTHVAQMEYAGSRYLVEAFHAQTNEGYGYVPGEKPHLRDYNREQQASIVADYYFRRISGISTEIYEPYIAELRAGEL